MQVWNIWLPLLVFSLSNWSYKLQLYWYLWYVGPKLTSSWRALIFWNFCRSLLRFLRNNARFFFVGESKMAMFAWSGVSKAPEGVAGFSGFVGVVTGDEKGVEGAESEYCITKFPLTNSKLGSMVNFERTLNLRSSLLASRFFNHRAYNSFC